MSAGRKRKSRSFQSFYENDVGDLLYCPRGWILIGDSVSEVIPSQHFGTEPILGGTCHANMDRSLRHRFSLILTSYAGAHARGSARRTHAARALSHPPRRNAAAAVGPNCTRSPRVFLVVLPLVSELNLVERRFDGFSSRRVER